MGAARITVQQRETFWAALREGMSVANASRIAGFSQASGERLVAKPANGQDYRNLRAERTIPDIPVPLDAIPAKAKAALEDKSGFLFCKRYFGYELSPFQMMVWRDLEEAWEQPSREYLCLNGPPGLGKSTTFVMFAAKRIVLNRAIRILFISRASRLAVNNTSRLRRALMRTAPAFGADTTLSGDFGRFKPRQGGDVWRAEEYVVEQMDGSPVEEKEPTVAAYGFDSEWLGNRIDLLFGDDLDSTRGLRNMETVETNREIYDGELEPRIEESGLFVIGQQRLGPFDFSAHVLSKVILPDDDGSEEEPDAEKMYRHITYKVHYEDRCSPENHKADSPAYPEGCLLDPRRMPWRDVRKAMGNPRFRTVYQQEDTSEEDALVQRIWVDGGRDTDGAYYQGCWDKDRGSWELPQGLANCLGIVTVDPSPTRYWSIQAWAVQPDSEQRFLLDLHRERMDAPEFLDWSANLNVFTGLLEDWWHLFKKVGVPLSYVIVEINAAQRFMLQYDHFQRWTRSRKVLLIPHSTARNKGDPEFGVQMIAPKWKHGQVRLPGKNNDLGRIHAMRLVDEVLRYPNATSNDCVMGQWFLEHNLINLKRRGVKKVVKSDPRRPSWAA